jgi:hypothetical protein
MNITILTLLSNVLLVTIPSLIIGISLYLIIRAYIRRDQGLRMLELRDAANKETRMLRLQAYERMVLFLERISPAALITRVLDADMVNHEMQLAMIRTIKSEYEHNLSQQLYISSDSWNLIVSAKDEIIKAISMIGAQVPSDASGQQVGRVILESISRAGQMLPNQTALEYLKNEARGLM